MTYIRKTRTTIPTIAAVLGAAAIGVAALGTGTAEAQYPPPPRPTESPSPTPSPDPSPSPTASPDPTFSPSPAPTVPDRPDSTESVDTELTTGTPGGTIKLDFDGRPATWNRVGITATEDGNGSTAQGTSDRRVAFESTREGRELTLAVPQDLAPGEYEVTVEGTDAEGNTVTEKRLIAVGDARNASAGPFGDDAAPIVLGIAGLAIVAGGATSVIRRRRLDG